MDKNIKHIESIQSTGQVDPKVSTTASVSTLGLGSSVDMNSIKVETLPHKLYINNEEVKSWRRNKIQVREDGIYSPCCEFSEEGTETNYRLMMSKEDFISAYNKYINDDPSKDSNRTLLPDKDSYFRSKMDTYSFHGGIGCQYSEPCFKCPNCGGNVRKNLGMVLTSYPPQYRYECDKCDYVTTGV